MSSEFVLGLHGEITFDGVRLAGLYPHDQVKTAEAVGADIFGPAVNVKAARSTPWNLARAATFVKETVKVAGIPVHPNVGMGVCGLPMIADGASGIVAKCRIAELLDIEINSVNKFKSQLDFSK